MPRGRHSSRDGRRGPVVGPQLPRHSRRGARWLVLASGAVAALAGACSGPQPSSVPLSPAVSVPERHRRSGSARATVLVDAGAPTRTPPPELEPEPDEDD